MSKSLSAGTYTIICSSNATWSCNSISNFSGFAAVYGTYSDAKKTTTGKSSKKISLSKKSAKIQKGQKLKLKLKNAKASKVKWTSSRKKVATVSKKGVVKAKKKGKTTITAKYKGKKYRCKITVKKSGMTRTQAYNKAKNYIKKNGFKETDGVYRINLGKDNAGFEYSFLYYEEKNWIACWAEANKKAIVLCIPKNKNRTFCE
ncbi:MAG: Ig-like domain-containing protein, partial [Eubacterium sp.]|nr:Ig-like domain-containing protein [Eubacterium sp.]